MERRTRSYLQLIKPGITLSNTLAAVAGYFLAANVYGFGWGSFLAVTFGVAMIIASACVVNNMIDRRIDAKMGRTRGREIAAGHISLPTATLFATVLGTVGFCLLMEWTNWPTVGLGVLSYVWYVAIYGWAKRTTPLSTVIGAVPGALPPAAGYVALAGQFDAVSMALFQILLIWQLPHFYSIGVFRMADYRNAGLPVWPVKYGTHHTRVQIMVWVVLYALTVPILTILGATGAIYLIVMLATGIYWVAAGLYSDAKTDEAWSRQMFGTSILVLLVSLLAIGAGAYLP